MFSYFRSSGHVMSECRISFGNIHFLGELICLCTSTGIIIPHLWFSFVLPTKFFVSPHILTVFECALFSRSYKVRIIAHWVMWNQNVGFPLEIFISSVN